MKQPISRTTLSLTLSAILSLSMLSGLFATAEAKVIHRERSVYSTILVDQRGSTLCLQFSVRKDQRNQTCLDQDEPRKMVFPYARMMMLSLLLVPDPESILIVGLGGGTLPMALHELYPEAIIDVAEIDPAVKTVAETYFGFSESDQVTVILKDARVFTKRALNDGRRYDLIMLDAFNGDYIPEHLMTREYLEENRALLSERGALAANTFAISRLYDHESNTYQAVFEEFFNIRSKESANRVILASAAELPDRQVLSNRARELRARLLTYGIRVNDYLPDMTTEADWDSEARVLTDQYSPANLLSNQ